MTHRKKAVPKTSGARLGKLHKSFCFDGRASDDLVGSGGHNLESLHKGTQKTFMDHEVTREVVVLNVSLF